MAEVGYNRIKALAELQPAERGRVQTKGWRERTLRGAQHEEVVVVDEDEAEPDKNEAPDRDHPGPRDRLLRFAFTGIIASVDSAHMVGVRSEPGGCGGATARYAPSCASGGRRCCASGGRPANDATTAAGGCGGSSESESSMIRETHSNSSTSCDCGNARAA